MNLYLNKRIDRTYMDAVLWRHKYPWTSTQVPICNSSPAASAAHVYPCPPRDSARLRGPPLLSTLTKALEFISSALGGCAGRIISSKATDFQAVKCPSRIYQQY